MVGDQKAFGHTMHRHASSLMSLSFAWALLFSVPGWSTGFLHADVDHRDHPATGRKLASPGPEQVDDFIQVDQDARHVTLSIMATYNDANYGMNFNGHFKGKAYYTIPLGWKVTVSFKNMSPVPHSAVVVEEVMTRKLQVGEPYFEGGASKEPLKGLVKEDSFTFVVDEAGKFAIACGFPAHAAGGHWIGLKVKKDISRPELFFPAPVQP